MFFTDYIRKNTTDISILTKEDFNFFDKRMFNDGGKSFVDFLYRPDVTTLFFDRGLIIFKIFDDYNEENKVERMCFIYALCKKKESKVNWKEWKEEFWRFCRLNKCVKVKMLTDLNPNFWIDNYGFKLIKHEMELDL